MNWLRWPKVISSQPTSDVPSSHTNCCRVPVKLGRRGDGYAEVLEGVKPGEEVVTTATFLIDAESNLRAALKVFTPQEAAK